MWHVFQMQGWFHFAWWTEYVLKPHHGGLFDPRNAPATAAAVIQSSWLMPALYVAGVLACVYHLANGVWTAGITWGVWTSPRAQTDRDRPVCGPRRRAARLGVAARSTEWKRCHCLSRRQTFCGRKETRICSAMTFHPLPLSRTRERGDSCTAPQPCPPLQRRRPDHDETAGDDRRRRPGRIGGGHETGRIGLRRRPDEPHARETLA